VERLLSTQDLADYLGVSLRTVYNWRYRSEGPPAIRVGGKVLFRESELQEWLTARSERPREPVG
jgi:excisionase family DNA binding protein